MNMMIHYPYVENQYCYMFINNLYNVFTYWEVRLTGVLLFNNTGRIPELKYSPSSFNMKSFLNVILNTTNCISLSNNDLIM